jgi:hypothetical protein
MQFSVDIQPDEEGYTGRECPKCEKYFKIEFGTGLEGATDCHCPYCNHVASHDEFWTKQQIEYAQSVAMNKMTGEFLKGLKKLERKPDRRSFISIGIKVTGKPTRIVRYSEKQLEEKIVCDNCTLNYTIYGSFGFCPDCGIHNSLQIAQANFDLVLRMLDLSKNAEEEIKTKMIENCLEDAVSAFDGFGREHCRTTIANISFQNIVRARDRLANDHGVDISSGLSASEWSFVAMQFQKRHLLAHTMGVIDQDFIDKTGIPSSMIGKKVQISQEYVSSLVTHLGQISKTLCAGIQRS